MKIKTLIRLLIAFYVVLIFIVTYSVYVTKEDYNQAKLIHDDLIILVKDRFEISEDKQNIQKLEQYNKKINILSQDIEENVFVIYIIMIVASLSFFFTYMEIRRKVLNPIYEMNEIIISFQDGNKNVKEIQANDDEIGLMIKEFFIMKNMLDEDYDEMQKVASTDPLTGILNRRAFFDISEKVSKLASRNKETLSLMILDIDHFKHVNDTYGHLIGDEIIKYLVERVEKEVRASDIFARFGGEEFIILLPNTDEMGAFTLADKIREMVEIHPYIDGKLTISFTISIGIAELGSEKLLRDLIRRADSALYEAKENGRNKVARG